MPALSQQPVSFAIGEGPYSSSVLTATCRAGIDHGVLAVENDTNVGSVQDRCLHNNVRDEARPWSHAFWHGLQEGCVDCWSSPSAGVGCLTEPIPR